MYSTKLNSLSGTENSKFSSFGVLELLVKPTSWNRALSKEYTTDEFTKWNTGLEFTYTGSDKQSENEMQVEVTEKHGESYRYIPDIANQQLSSCFGSSRSPQ